MTTTATRPDNKRTLRAAEALAPHAFEASSLLKVLGHEGRLTVLTHLRDGEKTVRQLQALMAATQPVVSSHLARLRFEGIVSFRRVGKSSYYALSDDKAREVLEVLDRVFCPGLVDRADGPLTPTDS
ncbi:helix-turn-helix transcriptional regulator [Maritimibacter sp. HL-12]|jgi:DNA-binding transcriptional ArsR family regulator|uniref:ArsR/SmtB family transcription factor n=1 Tax=Maritimibacter sp. HL-12 TaxID=1162418 RepID=UPI000A0F2DAB|nr:metalloregulator ArsR/SmtB family transcription factor [Maritimibacter sp. HL-12]SMH48665.1 DNA-binding transcriptional regulator, ArsR family [Maritimibacter sp. HL-12]